MIPAFTEGGVLPPGIHPASLAEIEARFGSSTEVRRAQMESIHWLMDLARRAGIARIVLNGSFVTNVLEPNDVDCVLLIGSNIARDIGALAELRRGLPFLDIEIVHKRGFERLVNRFFGKGRRDEPKGVLEVLL